MDDHLSVDEIEAFNRRAARFFEARNAFAPHLGAPLRERKTMSLQEIDREVAKVSTAPRVSLADIEGAIAMRYDVTAYKATEDAQPSYLAPGFDHSNPAGFARAEEALTVLSLCILVLKNGFTIVGKSAPASAENFNAELGRDLAYRDACSQCWPLMGYALRDLINRDKHPEDYDQRTMGVAPEKQAPYDAGSGD